METVAHVQIVRAGEPGQQLVLLHFYSPAGELLRGFSARVDCTAPPWRVAREFARLALALQDYGMKGGLLL